MTAKLIDGKAIAAGVRHNVKKKIDARKQNGQRIPGLAVVQVGHVPASEIYVRNKCAACNEAGVLSSVYQRTLMPTRLPNKSDRIRMSTASTLII